MTDNQRTFVNMLRDIESLRSTIENMQGELDYQRGLAGKFAADKLSGQEHHEANKYARSQGWIRTP
jgi:hypothetical protein